MNNLTNLFDKRSVFNALGCLIKEPTLLEEYKILESDFETNVPFYKIVFFAVNNLFYQGVKRIDIQAIDALLASHTKAYKIFQENNGLQYCATALEQAETDNFEFYYNRIRKFAYLRSLEQRGLDTRLIYDTTIVDANEAEKELEKFDSMSINDMADLVENRLIIEPRSEYITESTGGTIGSGMRELKNKLKEAPEYGIPLQSDVLSTIAHGARLGKLYLRSSGTGGGKSRTGMADCCNFAIPQYYDTKTKEWVIKGQQEPTLFISAELQPDELQTLVMAYVSGVNEEHILDGSLYKDDEEQRVDRAIDYIEKSPIYYEFMPDFSVQDIENKIKYYVRKFGVKYVCIDYVHMSARLITDMATMSKGMKLREDMILFLFIDTLKNICNKYNIFMLAMTQLNGSYKDALYKDESLLRGAKSMADRIDLGEISLKPTASEIDAIAPILQQSFVVRVPNLVRHVYKVRRGKLTRIKIWQKADLGTCRTEDLFVTDFDNNLIEVDVRKLTPVKVEEMINQHSEDAEIIEEDKEEAKKLFDF